MEMVDVKYLNPHQKEYYEKKLREAEAGLQATQSSIYKSEKSIDKKQFIDTIKQTKKVLDTKTAPHIAGIEKDKLNRRRQDLERLITNGMPTKDEMWGRKIMHSDGGYHWEALPDIVKRNTEWVLRNQNYINEWKNIMRQLEPDDPSVTNVERLRKLH